MARNLGKIGKSLNFISIIVFIQNEPPYSGSMTSRRDRRRRIFISMRLVMSYIHPGVTRSREFTHVRWLCESWVSSLELHDRPPVLFSPCTISHPLLLNKLMIMGFPDSALSWMRSYLSGRSQAVLDADGARSNWLMTSAGVPEGSVLGPLLLYLYLTFDQHWGMRVVWSLPIILKSIEVYQSLSWMKALLGWIKR